MDVSIFFFFLLADSILYTNIVVTFRILNFEPFEIRLLFVKYQILVKY